MTPTVTQQLIAAYCSLLRPIAACAWQVAPATGKVVNVTDANIVVREAASHRRR